jgi:hypothetical protein
MAAVFAKAKKLPIKVSAPKAPGRGPFAKSTAPPKSKLYTKDVLRQDPLAYTGFGFGETGLRETPSILGMAKALK